MPMKENVLNGKRRRCGESEQTLANCMGWGSADVVAMWHRDVKRGMLDFARRNMEQRLQTTINFKCFSLYLFIQLIN